MRASENMPTLSLLIANVLMDETKQNTVGLFKVGRALCIAAPNSHWTQGNKHKEGNE